MRETNSHRFDDPYSPRRRAWMRIWLKAKCVLALVALLLVAMFLVGVPHVQGNYKAHHRSDRFTPARDKYEANYLGPTGWRTIDAADTNFEGLPVLLFIPIDECFGFSLDYPFLFTQGD